MNGTSINLHFLGIGNGLTVSIITPVLPPHAGTGNRSDDHYWAQDPLSQYPGYLSYAASNPYVRSYVRFASRLIFLPICDQVSSSRVVLNYPNCHERMEQVWGLRGSGAVRERLLSLIAHSNCAPTVTVTDQAML